jgi:hypothetical protein
VCAIAGGLDDDGYRLLPWDVRSGSWDGHSGYFTVIKDRMSGRGSESRYGAVRFSFV